MKDRNEKGIKKYQKCLSTKRFRMNNMSPKKVEAMPLLSGQGDVGHRRIVTMINDQKQKRPRR